MRLDPEQLRRFARRDWAAPERLARRHRATQSIADKLAAAAALYEGARAANPGWPDEAARQLDLKAHIRQRARLNLAAHVGTR